MAPIHRRLGSANSFWIRSTSEVRALGFFCLKGETTSGYLACSAPDASQNEQSYDWGFELAAPVLLGIPNHAVQPAPLGQLGLGGAYYAANHNDQNAASVFVKQAYLRLKGVHSNIRFGRFEFTDGGEVTPKDETLAIVKRDGISQRLIGTFGFSDVQRSFDGAQYNYTNGDWNALQRSVPCPIGAFQVDGWGWVKTPVTYVAVTKQAHFGPSNAEWRVFGLYYNDDRPVVKTDNRPAAARADDLGGINIGTFGGNYIQAIPTAAGTFDLLGWGVLQTGRWGLLTQRSGAGATEIGFQPKIAAGGPGCAAATSIRPEITMRTTILTVPSSPSCRRRACTPGFRSSTR